MSALSLRAAAARSPDRDALVIGSERFSFADLVGPVTAAAQWIATHRRGEGPIAFIAERSFDTIILMYAALELGVCLAPIHERLSAREADERTRRVSPSLTLPCGFRFPRHRGESALVSTAFDEASALAVLFTSGSTGTARAAILSRRAFLASAAASTANLGWHDHDRWLLSLSPAHVAGLSILTRCLIARRCLVVDTHPRFDAVHTAELLAEQRVTLWSAVPTMLSRLMSDEARWSPAAPLRAVLLGGAAPSAALLRACAERGVPALTTYGMTETCAQVCTQPLPARPGPLTGAGPPLNHAELRIASDGAIEVRTASLLDGYLPPHHAVPPMDQRGWYRTGDRGRIDHAGQLHVLGRLDHVVVTGGECVDPLEVERALEELPGISEACVFGVPDADWGELVAAAVVGDVPLDHDAIRVHLRDRLAGFKHPRRIHALTSMPVGALGKRDRDAVIKESMPHLAPL